MSDNTRVWFITGASSGFGLALARAALERGERVVASARNPDALEDLRDSDPESATILSLDVTDAAAARSAIGDAASMYGRVDVVVNNAGYGHVGAIEELSEQEYRHQLEVNLFGVINVTRAALPQMRSQRSGQLVQMSSLNGVEGLVGGGYYAASKFAIEGLSESLADEVAHLGIKVMIIEPGPHRTRFLNERSARWAEPIPDYAASVGQTREALSALDGAQPGDPDRAAAAIIAAVNADDPPRRLALGQMALDNIRATLSSHLDELDRWAELSATSDYRVEGADGNETARAPSQETSQ
jgi:NAD(P)-dependent dehydrogenase (short-subunit alcohol dehydrogenase family)